MKGQLICRVKPLSTWIVVGFFTLCSLGYATLPHWSSRSFYLWQRLDVAWLIGASACFAMMTWLIPRYLLRLRTSRGWGVWVRDEALFLVSRAKPIPLAKIYQVRLGTPPIPTVVLTLNDGSLVVISAWAMDLDPGEIATRIEEARTADRLNS